MGQVYGAEWRELLDCGGGAQWQWIEILLGSGAGAGGGSYTFTQRSSCIIAI